MKDLGQAFMQTFKSEVTSFNPTPELNLSIEELERKLYIENSPYHKILMNFMKSVDAK